MASAQWGGTPRRARRVSVSIGSPVRAWWSSATLRAWSTRADGTAGSGGGGQSAGRIREARERFGRSCGAGSTTGAAVNLLRGAAGLRFGARRGVGEERAAEEGEGGPAGDQDAQPGGNVGRGQGVRRWRRWRRARRPGRWRTRSRRRGRLGRGAQGAQSVPGGDQEQVDGDRVGPGLPAVLPGGFGDVVQVGEGQGTGDDGLHEDGIRGGAGASGNLLPRVGAGAGRGSGGHAARSRRSWGATRVWRRDPRQVGHRTSTSPAARPSCHGRRGGSRHPAVAGAAGARGRGGLAAARLRRPR